MKTSTKIMMGIEMMIIIIAIIIVVGQKPTAITPISGHVIQGTEEFKFEFENADTLVLARNKEFSNAIEFDKDFAIKLQPGIYWWKVKNVLQESETRNFTLTNKVALRLEEENGTLMVYNVGNVEVGIRVLEGEEIFNKKNITLIPEEGTRINTTKENLIVEGGMK